MKGTSFENGWDNGEYQVRPYAEEIFDLASKAALNSAEDEELKKYAKSMKPLTKLYSDDIIRKLRNKYSSLLFRDLIQAHCGVLIAAEKSPDGIPEIECRVKELSKSNRKQFGDICAAILGSVLKLIISR